APRTRPWPGAPSRPTATRSSTRSVAARPRCRRTSSPPASSGCPRTSRRTVSPGLLDGVTVLDLSTVGPATRCTRLLADYGARVVKVGAPPRAGVTPLVPPFHAYSGQRGLARARVDLKAPAGRDAFLRLAARADVVVERFRPAVGDRAGIAPHAGRSATPGVVYCSTSGYGQNGPYAARAGHDIDYLATGGYLHMSGRADGGRPPLPGATVADIAAGGLQA